MEKLIIASCLALAGLALPAGTYAAASDPIHHVISAGFMSRQPGTTLEPAPAPAADDPEWLVIRAGLRSAQPGSRIPAERRFRVNGPEDPVAAVLRSRSMTTGPEDFARGK